MEQPVKLFALSTCRHCKAVKKFLDDCTVKYEFSDIDLLSRDERQVIIEELKKLSEECSFPTIIIGNKVIIGFKEKEIREALNLS